ncbi:MAG TPA: CheR family methyltransferase [Candidatus Wallbacteria bacterium]|nr:MAG: Chemotaxis protein methyltransferase Cher2 [bacterium ADurb.Bin243]HOD42580.1 CheR family methyltransferase [Candidatus Wallbacteria bacterium]HPG56479.1 CheR family methyltransferase [Candidatus Wallbacteria bacterium]
MAFTFFFRDLHTIELTVKHLLPFISGRNKVRIWDAGCAMGPEPYTVAIVLAENMGRFAFRNILFDATDIDESNTFEKIVTEGIYPEDELKRIPADIFEKYFKPADKPGFFMIDEAIRSRMQFKKHNLLSLKPVGEDYSLIICKNVLLHFQPEERVKVIKMFYDSLAPGGYFITEQTQKMPEELAHLFQKVVDDAQLFKKI